MSTKDRSDMAHAQWLDQVASWAMTHDNRLPTGREIAPAFGTSARQARRRLKKLRQRVWLPAGKLLDAKAPLPFTSTEAMFLYEVWRQGIKATSPANGTSLIEVIEALKAAGHTAEYWPLNWMIVRNGERGLLEALHTFAIWASAGFCLQDGNITSLSGLGATGAIISNERVWMLLGDEKKNCYQISSPAPSLRLRATSALVELLPYLMLRAGIKTPQEEE